MANASARHILVSSEEQCLALKQEIENGRDFADVTKQHSSCPFWAASGRRLWVLFGPGQWYLVRQGGVRGEFGQSRPGENAVWLSPARNH